MNILIAPNAFKGSLTALQAARAMAKGIHQAVPKTKTILMPIADGGDGLMECLLVARGGRRINTAIRGPLGEPRRSSYARLPDGTAVIEMALASGLALLPRGRSAPMTATTLGTGQLILAALKSGARRLIVGLGGSASSDGGAGMAQALGARFFDENGRILPPGGGVAALAFVARIDASPLRRMLTGVSVIGVSDVVNPLLGPRGSACVFGPQKGATPDIVRAIEGHLAHYAAVVARDVKAGASRRPGAGAAGGLGFGLLTFLRGRIVPGAAYVLDACDARQQVLRADAVMTGEGRIDATSFLGKAPIELTRLARRQGRQVAVVCGSLEAAVAMRLRGEGVASIVTLSSVGATKAQSVSRADFWAAKAAAVAMKGLSA